MIRCLVMPVRQSNWDEKVMGSHNSAISTCSGVIVPLPRAAANASALPLPGRELERNEACRANRPERPPGCESHPRFDWKLDLLPLAHVGLVDRQEVRSRPPGTGRRPQLGGQTAWLARPHRQAALAGCDGRSPHTPATGRSYAQNERAVRRPSCVSSGSGGIRHLRRQGRTCPAREANGRVPRVTCLTPP
jgi:hypothetical protein